MFAFNTAPKSGLKLFKQLIMNDIPSTEHWNSKRNRIKFALRSAIMPISTLKLLGGLANTPSVVTLIKQQPLLPSKLQRPYLSINFSRKNKLNAINDHYKITNKYFNNLIFSKIYSGESYNLATITGKDCLFFLTIEVQDCFNKEGELTISLKNEQGVILARCAFTFLIMRGKRTLFIGALQGGEHDCSLDLIREATKACYGLFPKRLLLEAISLIGTHFECSQILAASNQTHIYRSHRYWHKKKGVMNADYDSFWISLDGNKNSDSEYELPLKIARKPIEDVASKKRAEYRRRYQLLDDFTHNVNASLSQTEA